tara:strand:+ start:1078 stop:2610 length:1533 start_codon:yes stop_codon:yes gene_type:complete
MKLVITESQYNRVFNKIKTKLVITESQYNKILLESNMTKTISKIEEGDAIKLIDKSNNELFFKVLEAFSGKIIMINCNDGVMKNNFYYMGSDSLINNSLKVKFRHLKNIKDSSNLEGIKSEIDSWAKSTFKNIKSFEVFEGAGKDLNCNLGSKLKPKFNVNPETGVIEDPDSGNEPDNEEEGRIEDYKNDFLSEVGKSNRGESYNMEFKDGGYLNLIVVNKGAGVISFEINGSSTGNEGERYQELIGDLIELKLHPDELEVKVNTVNNKNTGKPNYNLDYLNVKVKRYLGGSEEDEDKSKSEKMIIHGVDNYVSSKLKKDLENKESEELSDEELEDQIKNYTKNDKILRKALWNKPNWILDLLRISKERGILPADDRISRWYDRAKKYRKINREFKFNTKKTFEFTQFSVTNKDISKLPMQENKKYVGLVRKKGTDEIYPRISTNFDIDIKTNEFLKYNIFITNLIEDNDRFKIYEIKLKYRDENSKKYTDVGTGKVLIDNSNKKEDKKD